MRPFVWVDHYQKMGIWGCLNRFCQENYCDSWGIMLTFFHEHDYITPLGQIKNSMLFDVIHEPTINNNKGQGIGQYLIPVFLNKKLLFIWEFNTKVQIDANEMQIIKFNLELLITHESYDDRQYPSFLVFLYPCMGDMNLVNRKIIEFGKRSVIFLNGQQGSGKSTFLQCFLLLHYGYLIQKDTLTRNINPIQILLTNHKLQRLIYVPELALLSADEQIQLLYKEKEDNNQLIIASMYDTKVLYSNQIISEEMADLCTLNRILLPSLPNRAADIHRLLHFMIFVKASTFDASDNLNIEQLDKIFNIIVQNKHNLNETQQAIKKMLCDYNDDNNTKTVDLSNHHNMEIDSSDKNSKKELAKEGFTSNHISLERLNDSGVNLRNIVAELEMNAIRYAHSQVGNSQNKMSNFLGISRGSLQNKLKKYDLDYDDWLD